MTKEEPSALLDELAAAYTDRQEHHSIRFKDEHEHPLGFKSEAKLEDWNRCYHRYEAAKMAMVKFALAREHVVDETPAFTDEPGLTIAGAVLSDRRAG